MIFPYLKLAGNMKTKEIIRTETSAKADICSACCIRWIVWTAFVCLCGFCVYDYWISVKFAFGFNLVLSRLLLHAHLFGMYDT